MSGRVAAALLAVGLAVGACDKAPPVDLSAKVPSIPDTSISAAMRAYRAVPVDGSTPDRAVKSLWAMHAARQAARCAVVRQAIEGRDKDLADAYDLLMHVGQRDELFAGAVARWHRDAASYSAVCAVEAYDRVINTVEIETPSRAVVYAALKNTTPLPEGVGELADYERKARTEGEPFRYVLTKAGDRWLVEDVYKTSALGGDEWRLFDGYEPQTPWQADAF